MALLLQNINGQKKRKMPNFRGIKSTSLNKKMLNKSIAILILSMAVLFVNSCQNTSKQRTYTPYTIQGKTQGTTYTIIADDEKLLSLQVEIDSILADFDKCLSSYRDSSIVNMISNADTGLHIYSDINQYFTRCFQASVDVYKLSEGAFDPSIFPLVSAWGFLKNPAISMSQMQVDSVLQLTGFDAGVDYELDLMEEDKHTLKKFAIRKLRASLKLDFNAIAQGLSVDVLCEFLNEQGIQNYYVEIGGELRVKGTNKEGQPWRIGIDLADESNAKSQANRTLTAIIAVENSAVATSGSYRKFYEKDGKKFSHTIDPKTGYPVQHNLLSATVVAENAAFADALATVFMVWGTEKTIEFVSINKEYLFEVLLQFTNEDGQMETYISPGMKLMLQE
jgi:thiamine biosynthesis lipoprotein